LIKLAPVGVFFLILSNLFTLDIEDIGQNLGVLVGASIVNMAIHMFVVFVRSTPTDMLTSKIADLLDFLLANPLLHLHARKLLHLLVQMLPLVDYGLGNGYEFFSFLFLSSSPSSS
jgi:hypothetical protein